MLAFVAMEAVSYALHRWVMHGPGMVLHASHHAPPGGRFERNDLFPAGFAVIGVVLFALTAWGPLPGWVWWAAAGITAYGIAYLAVHEVFIHRRLPLPVPASRYLGWLRDSHRAHHVDGGEPYGMLLPLMSARDRHRVATARDAQPVDDDDRLRRAITRSPRQRL
ncbi:MAG TPA: sterol desaturase family protein [Ilumatobacter sp.]